MPSTTTQIIHFSSTPQTIVSDHKPVHVILELPPAGHKAAAPHLAPVLPPAPPPHQTRPPPTPYEQLMAYKLCGMICDRLVGWPWCLVVLLGGGNAQAGMGISAFVAMIWGIWWSGFWTG